MEEERPRPVSTPGMAFKNVIFEQTSKASFLVFDRAEGKFLICDDVWRSYSHDGIEYIALKRLPWPTEYLPKDESEEQLFNEIRQFFLDHLDIANESLYDVYSCFVMASWRLEDFTVVPYLFFLGPMSSGKTRALECFHRLCYRSIMATSMSAASLFRALEAWHPTLLLDETEIYNRENMVEVLALLNSGYRKGQFAIRVEKVEQGSLQIAMFDTFGFKVLAGTEELAATLQSRCIITSMSKAVRQVRLFVDEEKAQELRDKLLMYRFKKLGKNLERLGLDGLSQNARVIELFISLMQVAPTPEIRQRLLTCMRGIARTQLEEEQAGIEARVFDAVQKCQDKVEDGKLATATVAEVFNEELPEKERATVRLVGRKLRALGFERCRVGKRGQAGLHWDSKLVDRLRMRYRLPTSEVASVTSETSETSANTNQTIQEPTSKAEVTEQTEVTEDKSETSPETSPEAKAFLDVFKAVYWVDGSYGWHDCAICKRTMLTSWQAETFKDEKLWLCDDCKASWEKQHQEASS
jgi:hypothetical protein